MQTQKPLSFQLIPVDRRTALGRDELKSRVTWGRGRSVAVGMCTLRGIWLGSGDEAKVLHTEQNRGDASAARTESEQSATRASGHAPHVPTCNRSPYRPLRPPWSRQTSRALHQTAQGESARATRTRHHKEASKHAHSFSPHPCSCGPVSERLPRNPSLARRQAALGPCLWQESRPVCALPCALLRAGIARHAAGAGAGRAQGRT